MGRTVPTRRATAAVAVEEPGAFSFEHAELVQRQRPAAQAPRQGFVCSCRASSDPDEPFPGCSQTEGTVKCGETLLRYQDHVLRMLRWAGVRGSDRPFPREVKQRVPRRHQA